MRTGRHPCALVRMRALRCDGTGLSCRCGVAQRVLAQGRNARPPAAAELGRPRRAARAGGAGRRQGRLCLAPREEALASVRALVMGGVEVGGDRANVGSELRRVELDELAQQLERPPPHSRVVVDELVADRWVLEQHFPALPHRIDRVLFRRQDLWLLEVDVACGQLEPPPFGVGPCTPCARLRAPGRERERGDVARAWQNARAAAARMTCIIMPVRKWSGISRVRTIE